MQRPHPPRTRIESDIVEAEDAVHEFAARNAKVTVTTLRFCNGLGPDLRTSHTALLSLPAVPGILGFDPRYQFIHEDDIVGALHHAVVDDAPGRPQRRARRRARAVSEIAACSASRSRRSCRRGARAWRRALTSRIGVRIPDEVRQQLRYGRGLDNRKIKQSGYRFQLTTRETVQAFAAALRLKPLRESGEAPYRYEREVEEFLRWSPSVRRDESGG